MANLNTVVMALALALLSPLALATQELDEIYNYHALPQTLGSSGQPTPEQFAAIRAAGFDVVVNLAMPDSEKSRALLGQGRRVRGATLQGIRASLIKQGWKVHTRACGQAPCGGAAGGDLLASGEARRAPHTIEQELTPRDRTMLRQLGYLE